MINVDFTKKCIPYNQLDVEKYLKDLKLVGSLSGLFSDSDIPLLHYRATENLYCADFNATNLARADVSEEEQVKALFDFAKEKFGKLNGLVNNAGTNIDEFVETCSLENYMRVVNTNFIGKMLCSKYAIPLLKNQENACIVNISSSLGVRPDTECSAYCCSASAIITLTQCLAMELAEQNIRVNCVSPAFTPTPLSLAGWTEEEIKAKEKRNPRHRLGKVEDMANAVLFLLSEKADYINGENLKVNGGGILKK